MSHSKLSIMNDLKYCFCSYVLIRKDWSSSPTWDLRQAEADLFQAVLVPMPTFVLHGVNLFTPGATFHVWTLEANRPPLNSNIYIYIYSYGYENAVFQTTGTTG